MWLWAGKLLPPIGAGMLGATTELLAQQQDGKKITLGGIIGSLTIGAISALYTYKLFHEGLGWSEGMGVVMCYLSGSFFKVVAQWFFKNHKTLLTDLWHWIIRKK